MKKEALIIPIAGFVILFFALGFFFLFTVDRTEDTTSGKIKVEEADKTEINNESFYAPFDDKIEKLKTQSELDSLEKDSIRKIALEVKKWAGILEDSAAIHMITEKYNKRIICDSLIIDEPDQK